MNKIKQVGLLALTLVAASAAIMLGALNESRVQAQPSPITNPFNGGVWVNASTSGWTNAIVASSAYTPASPPRLDLTGGRELALEFRFQMSASSTANQIFMLGRNINGTGTTATNIEAWTAISIPANGTTYKTVLTNWSSSTSGANIAGVPYLYLMYATNADGTAYNTNLTIRYWIK